MYCCFHCFKVAEKKQKLHNHRGVLDREEWCDKQALCVRNNREQDEVCGSNLLPHNLDEVYIQIKENAYKVWMKYLKVQM
jgi:hypothetical protein